VLLVAISSLREGTRQLDSRVQLVLDAVTTDPAKSHTLTQLAALAQVSVSRLAHLFKEQVGDSIMNVVLALRLQRASELLAATDLSIAQVSRAVGFDSPHYFSRQFARRLGQSPTAYRRAAR
jgi:AraC family transcriptional regulator of arabinose operon